jgi:hypothetical protein
MTNLLKFSSVYSEKQRQNNHVRGRHKHKTKENAIDHDEKEKKTVVLSSPTTDIEWLLQPLQYITDDRHRVATPTTSKNKSSFSLLSLGIFRKDGSAGTINQAF